MSLAVTGIATVSLLASVAAGITARQQRDDEHRDTAAAQLKAGAAVKTVRAQEAATRQVVPEIPVAKAPDVVGLLPPRAQAIFQKSTEAFAQPDAPITTETKPYAGEPGRVVAQEPAPGRPIGESVALTISSPASTPDLHGSAPADASRALVGLGSGVVYDQGRFDPTLPAGQVMSTSPTAGLPLPLSTTVFVNSAKASVPLGRSTTFGSDPCSSGSSVKVGGASTADALACFVSSTKPTEFSYALRGGVGQLVAGLGVADTSQSGTRLHVVIRADGRPAVDQDVTAGPAIPVTVPLTGAQFLSVSVTKAGGSPSTSGGTLVLVGGVFDGAPKAIESLGGPTAPADSTLPAPPVPPTTSTDAIAVDLLIDTSGSMNDRDTTGASTSGTGPGIVKIEGAKNAASAFIDSLPDNALLGIRTYPDLGQTGGDCSEGTRRLAVGPLDRGSAKATISGVTADGGTPTAAALRASAKDLPAVGRRTIVLISDGESNCGEAPCDVAKELIAQGLDVQVDTIGFQISATGESELQCIAAATHGRYAAAQNSQDLAADLQRISQADLGVTLDYTRSITFGPAGPNPAGVRITARLSNRGTRDAIDPTVALTFAPPARETRAPALVDRLRPLGNLRAGTSAEVTWTFPVPDPGGSSKFAVPFDVTLTGPNLVDTKTSGQIGINGFDGNRDGLDPLIRGLRRPVILGDSYSSGEGAGRYETATTTALNRCHRSPYTYGTTSDNNSAFLQRWNLACSGAISADITSPNGPGGNHDLASPTEPLRSQVRQIRDLFSRQAQHRAPTPDGVILTMGGNDIGFRDLITHCVAPTNCETTRLFPGSPLPVSGESFVRDRLAGLRPSLMRAYAAIQNEMSDGQSGASRAPIFVLAYPQPFPEGGGARNCSSLSQSERAWLVRVVHRLNVEVHAAVADARSRGVPAIYVRATESAFLPQDGTAVSDHTLCSDDPYLNPIDPLALASLDPNLINQLVHPSRSGYQRLTQAFLGSNTSDQSLAPLTIKAHPTAPPEPSASLPTKILSLSTGEATNAAKWLVFTGSGLPSGAPFQLGVRSSTQVLANGVADQRGSFATPVWIPGELRGDHRVVLLGFDPQGRPFQRKFALEIHETSWVPGSLPWLLLMSVLVLIAGIIQGSFSTRERRRRQRPSSPTAA